MYYFCAMTVQQYIASQPDPQREIFTILRTWILDLGPHAAEKISYGVPYFYFYGPLCYLSTSRHGIHLSFSQGRSLSDEDHLLESRDRKQVRSVSFESVAVLEEREDAVRRLLNEAAILNEYHTKQKQKKKRTA